MIADSLCAYTVQVAALAALGGAALGARLMAAYLRHRARRERRRALRGSVIFR